MPKIYLFIVIAVGIYFAATAITREKCRVENAVSEKQKIQETVKTKRNIDEKVFNTGANDVRNILRAKYTIRD